jgi:hypothetical protein
MKAQPTVGYFLKPCATNLYLLASEQLPTHSLVEAPRRVAGQHPCEQGVRPSLGQSACHRAKQASPDPRTLVFSQQV